jgi:hypothetical protein
MAHRPRRMAQRTLPLPTSMPSLHALLTTAVAHAFDTLRGCAKWGDLDPAAKQPNIPYTSMGVPTRTRTSWRPFERSSRAVF